jgi:phosphoenolpyruvate-protein kinase (PTS system EI component)
VLKGVMAAPGLAIGKAVRLALRRHRGARAGEGGRFEEAALAAAIDGPRPHREEPPPRATSPQGHPRRPPGLPGRPRTGAGARRLIGDGKSAGFSWRKAVGGYVEALRGLGDRRLAERVDDLVDLERQVLRALTGEEDEGAILPPGSILLADELLPSQLMGVDPGRWRASAPPRRADLARGHPGRRHGHPGDGRPGRRVLKVKDGATLILDADSGTLRVGPDARRWKPPRPPWPSARSARPPPRPPPTRKA